MIQMTDLMARNSLFDRGIALGLTWTRGETPGGRPTIYLPLRDPLALRASLYPFSHNWMLSWTSPMHGTETIKVDKLGRDLRVVLQALGAAIVLVIDRSVDSEPTSALQIIGFLGALGVALEDDAILATAVAGRQRAQNRVG
ncbi:MAG: hypothetical protein H7248_09235 [Microbacteriaceae bacterium]|nr:hypothetical protein [Microbacteriaceae bacterium]